ncbi:MAG: hypothetical protein ABF629_10500, partial [Sporolactobacillus sp.]
MTKILADIETGEKLEVVSYRTVEQAKAFKKKQQREQQLKKSDTPFIFSEMNVISSDKLLQLDNRKLGYFLIMQTYIDYNNIMRQQDAKLPMKAVQTRKALRISDNRYFKKIMNEFEELGLLKREKVKMYGKEYPAVIINEAYCFKGSRLGKVKSSNVTRVFIDTLQTVYCFQSLSMTPYLNKFANIF